MNCIDYVSFDCMENLLSMLTQRYLHLGLSNKLNTAPRI